MSYATAADLLIRKDARRIGELVRDDGTRATPMQLTGDPTAMPPTSADPNLQAALDDASGIINSAVLAGNRYQVTDLQNLAAGPDKSFLTRLTCEIAYGLLLERRGYNRQDTLVMAVGYQEALDVLTKLREGELVFNIPYAKGAGLPVNVTLDTNFRLITREADRYFGELDNNPGFVIK